MLPKKMDAGELLAGLGGLLLFVALFLDWYGTASAWEAFETLDLVLAVLGLTAVLVAARSFGLDVAVGPRVLLPVGLIAAAIVVVQLLEPPPGAPESELESGAWLALAGSALMLIGGILRGARISVTVAGREHRRVAAVDRRPDAAARAAAAPPAPAHTASEPPRHTPAPAPAPAPADPQATQPFKPVEK